MEGPRKSEINPHYVEWIICEVCKCKVYSRFKDYKLCMTCLDSVHKELSEKLNTEDKLKLYNKY